MGRGYGKVRAYFNVFPQARSKFAYFLVGKSVEHNQISYMDTECSDLDLFEPMKPRGSVTLLFLIGSCFVGRQAVIYQS